MKEIEKVWLAAMIDGEGSIGLHLSRTVLPTRVAYCLCPDVTISNHCPAILKRVQEILGNKCYLHTSGVNVCVHRRHVETTLREILPHLIGKKHIAETLLEWFKHRRAQRRSYKSYTLVDVHYLVLIHQLQLRKKKKPIKHLEEFKQFVKRNKPKTLQVLEFLESNKMAYTASEIAKFFEMKLSTVYDKLYRLFEQGHIKRKRVGRCVYWWC